MSDDFRWHPGQGPDEAALARLRRAFPKPAVPMGEAWFMGVERYLFEDFAARDIAEIR